MTFEKMKFIKLTFVVDKNRVSLSLISLHRELIKLNAKYQTKFNTQGD